jgi:predicted ester cyclase
MRIVRHVGASLALVAVLGCSGSASAPGAEAQAPAPKTTAQRAQWYQQCWGYFNERLWDRFQACYAATATSEQVGSTPSLSKGRAAVIQTARKLVNMWADVRGDLRLVLAHGPHAVSIAMWHGTNTGAIPTPDGKSIPATNKPFGFLMAHMVETDAAGREAVRDAAYVDEGTLMAQLGLSKAPARGVMTSTPAKPTVVVAKNDDAEAKNVATVVRLFDSFNRHDLPAADALMADSYVLHEIARPQDLDKKANDASTLELIQGFPDVKVTATDTWGAGDYVVATGTLSGTNKGAIPSMGVKKATGKPVQLKFLEIFRLENGKIVEDWLFYNGASFAAQLGLR